MILSSLNSTDLLICHSMAATLADKLTGNPLLALAANKITGALLAELTRRQIPLHPVTMTYMIQLSTDNTMPEVEIDMTDIDPDLLLEVNCEVEAHTPPVISGLFAEFIDGLNLDGIDGEGADYDDE